MARYFSGSFGRSRNWGRMWMYGISAVLIIIVLYYGYRIAHRRSQADSGRVKVEGGVAATGPKAADPNMLSVVPQQISKKSSPQVANLINEAVACINAQPPRVIEGRDRLNGMLSMPMSQQQRAFIKEQLSKLADRWLFSRTIYPQDVLCGSYKVKPGDKLAAISRQFKVPYEILMEVNGIHRPEQLQAGQAIKVINGPFHARINRSAFTMDLYLQNTYVRSFPVGLAREGFETPMGRWVVEPAGKLIKPTWTDPDTGRTYNADDPDYPLGSRWISLKGIEGKAVGRKGFAIHGTKDPNQIGAPGSRGCVRLHNGDAVQVYNLLMTGCSQVEVVE